MVSLNDSHSKLSRHLQDFPNQLRLIFKLHLFLSSKLYYLEIAICLFVNKPQKGIAFQGFLPKGYLSWMQQKRLHQRFISNSD